jgi:hypothetical protein
MAYVVPAMLRFLLLPPLFLLSTLPAAFITKLILKRRGDDVALFAAPMRVMMSVSTPEQLMVVALNFSVFGGFVYLLFWVL